MIRGTVEQAHPDEKPCEKCGGMYTAANVELSYLRMLSERERECHELRTEVERLRVELARRSEEQ